MIITKKLEDYFEEVEIITNNIENKVTMIFIEISDEMKQLQLFIAKKSEEILIEIKKIHEVKQ